MFFFIFFNLIFALDALLGEPPNAWHPVAWFGRVASHVECICRRGLGNGILSGTVAWSCMTIPGTLVLACGVWLLEKHHPWIALFAAAVICYFCIALRSLSDHAERIVKSLRGNDLPAARQALAMIVSRDTATLEESEIVRGGIESIGENLIDAVTSAWFWIFAGFCCCGLPGAVAGAVFLRAVNTLDACWGYKNERYLNFGRAAAKTDDWIHYIPARLTMIIIALASLFINGDPRRTLYTGWKHRHDHPSPNSGFGMASFAGALKIRLGGPTIYQGEPEPYPYWGDGRSQLIGNDLKRAKRLAWISGVLFVLSLEGGYALWRLFFI